MIKDLPKVILLIESSRAFGRDFQSGISRYARLHGPWSFLRQPRDLSTTFPRIKNGQADGIIMRNNPSYTSILNSKIPMITVHHFPDRNKEKPAVITDDTHIAKLAAEHLLNCGFQYYGFYGIKNMEWSEDRARSFRKYIEQAGYTTDIFEQPASVHYQLVEKELNGISKWLRQLRKPVGIMACNDDKGQQILEACKLEGLKVPEEVAVVGVDNDSSICELTDPPLSSVALNVENAGFRTAELLDRMMKGKIDRPYDIIVTPSLVIARQSSDILAIPDRYLVNALSFIRNNPSEKIKVADVVHYSTLSRRSLERRFKSLLGRTIQQEIRRVHVELITKMLLETDMSISEITSRLEFSDFCHIARYFRAEKGMSLRDFRRLQY